MATRLAHLAEKHHFLDGLQIGGRPKRSAVDAAMLLATKIDKANKKHLITSTLCIDVKGAFDNVYKPRLLHTMRKMKLHPSVTRWVEIFLSERLASLSFDKDKEPMTPIRTGIPQGLPASPIIFLLYLTPVFTLLWQTHQNITCPSYIDDICLMTKGTSAADNARELGDAVDTCFTWGDANAVAFDDRKSELMHVTTAGTLDTMEECYVQLPNGTRIKLSGTQRWLELWFNRKLTLKHHMRSKTASAIRVFMALSRLGNTKRGLSQSALRQLYQSCITTVADFAAEVW
jgi:hypothetical protein